jgi:outer membrane protein TolC
MRMLNLIVCGIAALSTTGLVMAQSNSEALVLQSAFEKARQVDPVYLAGIAEFQGNTLEAKASSYAFFPQVKLSSGQVETDGGSRRDSLTITQPILSADRMATFQESEPRNQLAEAKLALREMDLAKRLYAAYSEIASAREGLVQNKAKLSALDLQFTSAKRLLSLNQGTLTDVRDAEVKLLQARGEELSLKGQLQTAERRFASIAGSVPAATPIDISGTKAKRITEMATNLGGHITNPTMLADKHPTVTLAKAELKLAELDADRSRSAWMPELNLVHTQTRLGGASKSFTGLNVSLPLSASNYAQMQSAGAMAAVSAQDAAEAAREIALEVDRLKTSVEFGANQVAMQQAAVEAAQLSVEANEKSFKGGVRSSTDVLNSIEVLYSAKNDLVKSLLKLSEDLLNLSMLEGTKASDSLAEIERLVLR